jgi:hypothetical protein
MPEVLEVPRQVYGNKEVWCSCETEPGSRVAAVGSPGEESTSSLKAAQDEVSPAALCRKTPEPQGLLLVECEGVLLRNLLEADDASTLAMAVQRP